MYLASFRLATIAKIPNTADGACVPWANRPTDAKPANTISVNLTPSYVQASSSEI